MKRITRAKAIREKCIDCMCGQKNEVRLCPSLDCPLYAYRLGREDTSLYSDYTPPVRKRKTTATSGFDGKEGMA